MTKIAQSEVLIKFAPIAHVIAEILKIVILITDSKTSNINLAVSCNAVDHYFRHVKKYSLNSTSIMHVVTCLYKK